MKKITRALLLILLLLVCASYVNSQTQREAEEKLSETARDFHSKIDELVIKHEAYKNNKKANPKKATQIRNDHKEDAKNFLEESLIPSYNYFRTAFKDYEIVASTDERLKDKAQATKIAVEEIENHFGGLSSKIKVGEVTSAVDTHSANIAASLSNIINPQIHLQADPQSAPPRQENLGGGNASSLSHYFLLLIPFFLSILVSGAAIWWLKQEIDRVKNRITVTQQNNERNLARATDLININNLAIESQNAVEILHSRTVPEIKANINNLFSKVEILEHNSRPQGTPIVSYAVAPTANAHPPQQATVAEYLSRNITSSIKAKKALMRSDALQ